MPAKYSRVFVGISLRNKNLTKPACLEIVELARAEFGSTQLMFLIADELELINLRVFEAGTAQKLRQMMETKAAAIEAMIRSGAASIPQGRPSVSIVRWEKILNANYWHVFFQLWSLYVDNPDFRAGVEDVVSRFRRARDRQIGKAELRYLSIYVLSELPTLLRGVQVEGRSYLGMIYPARGTEAIDVLADRVGAGEYGELDDCQKICKVVRMPI